MTDTIPAPLGWCVDCLAEDKRTPAATIFDGHAVCVGCATDRRMTYEEELRALGQPRGM
jgi:hypothetical protein